MVAKYDAIASFLPATIVILTVIVAYVVTIEYAYGHRIKIQKNTDFGEHLEMCVSPDTAASIALK